jgi:hypothetical protein
VVGKDQNSNQVSQTKTQSHDRYLSSNELKLKAFKQLERLCAESERLFEELVRKTQRYDEVVFDAHNEKQTARETIDTLEDQVVKLEKSNTLVKLRRYMTCSIYIYIIFTNVLNYKITYHCAWLFHHALRTASWVNTSRCI